MNLPIPPQGGPGVSYIIFVAPQGLGPNEVGISYWSGSDYPTFLQQITNAQNAGLDIVALEEFPDGFPPPPPQINVCCYVYASFGGGPPQLAPTGKAIELPKLLADYNTPPWSVVDSGYFLCNGTPPTFTGGGTGGGGGGSGGGGSGGGGGTGPTDETIIDENTIIINLLEQIQVNLGAGCNCSGGGGSTVDLSMVVTALNAILKTLQGFKGVTIDLTPIVDAIDKVIAALAGDDDCCATIDADLKAINSTLGTLKPPPATDLTKLEQELAGDPTLKAFIDQLIADGAIAPAIGQLI